MEMSASPSRLSLLERTCVLLLVLCAALPRPTSAQDNDFPGKIDCYSFAGRIYSNNTQCPGSRICCETTDLCDPNRFCVSGGQHIIPACSSYPWTDCSNICQYDPGTGFLPRAVECKDGSFCCDNDPSCCSQGRGIVLNGLGAIVSTHSPTPTTSTTSRTPAETSPSTGTNMTATTTTTDASASSDAAAVPTQSSIDNLPSAEGTRSTGGLSTGAKAGIGISVAIAVVTVAVLAAFFVGFRRRQRTIRTFGDLQTNTRKSQLQGIPSSQYQNSKNYSDQFFGPSELETANSKSPFEVHEMPQRNSFRS